jgi:hypothetical protein
MMYLSGRGDDERRKQPILKSSNIIVELKANTRSRRRYIASILDLKQGGKSWQYEIFFHDMQIGEKTSRRKMSLMK